MQKLARYVELSFIMFLCVISCQLGAMNRELIQGVFGQAHIRDVICKKLSWHVNMADKAKNLVFQ